MANLTPVIIALLSGIIGIGFALFLALKIMKKPAGTDKMQSISDAIHKGAMTFLKREYKSVGIFVLILAVIIFFAISKKTAFAFVIGALCSVISGYLGMKIATRANTRAAQAASKSFSEALNVAFPGGAVVGMSVVGIGLFGLSLLFLLFIWHAGLHHSSFTEMVSEAVTVIIGFSMGASSVALFARVGGGIYTKAADVGADLVGKVEAGIPEDDPRNPAVIADNVGDNVGDVAGMGADLFESYVGAIIAAFVIAMAQNNIPGVMLGLLIAAWGIISSIAGVFFVKANERTDPQVALRMGMITTAVLLILGAFALTNFWYGNIKIFWAVLSGLVAGLVVGFSAEYYTSGRVVRELAGSAKTGAATTIIHGISIGMKSTAIPMIAIGLAILFAYRLGGIYGIALSAIGMLSITGMTVAVDAYGPIADNAAGIAEMAGMGPEVRRRAERLDAVGNTTAAVGKGFAIGSAALTALALFTAYSKASGLNVLNCLYARVVTGLFIGGVIPFVFSSSTMQAVGRTAFKVVEEVRRQFREIPGLMEGKAMPDASRCVDITTAGALKEMILPGIMAVTLPLLIGIFLGVETLGGFLVGSLVSGVPLAIFLANSGGAWDNAKKYIEEGHLDGKGSDVHKASVIGDTVGDPFKDTSGPSLNILLKLMAVVSLVFAPLIVYLNKIIGIIR